MKKYLGEIGLIITAIIWGSGFVASAVSLEYYTPYQIMAGRFFIGALILSIVFHKRLKQINKSLWIKGIILGAILYIAFVLQTVGLQFTTPSKNAFLTVVNVVIVPFIGFVLYKKKIDVYELIGAILAVIGVAVLSLQFTSEVNIGDLLTLACAFGFAFHIYYTAMFVEKEDPVLLTIIQMVTATFISVIGVLISGQVAFTVEPAALMPLLYLGVFSTTLAYLLQTVAQKYISETKAAIILSTEAFWGTAFSIIILSEVMTFRIGIGATLILLAIIITETKSSLLSGKKLEI